MVSAFVFGSSVLGGTLRCVLGQARHLTLTVPLSQVHKWVPLNGGGNPAMD